MSTQTAIPTDSHIETAERIAAIAAEVLRIDPADARIDAETNLYELGLESLNVVELLSQLETAFGITIDVEDLSSDLFGRFGNLVEFVETKRSQH